MKAWPRLVVTAFGPFAGEAVNASERLLRDLQRRFPRPLRPWREVIHLEVLECPEGEGALGRLEVQVEALFRRHGEALYLLTGQAAGRNHLAFERHAFNLFHGETIDPEGPPAYLADLPEWLDFPALLRRAGLPAWPSRDPGDGPCNHLHYRLCRLAQKEGVALRAGFLHIPVTPAQVVHHHPRAPAWPTTLVRTAVVALLRRLTVHLRPPATEPRLSRPKVSDWDHLVLPVTDVESSACFYARVLGMPVEHQGRMAWLHLGDRRIALQGHQGTGKPRAVELCLRVDQPLPLFMAHLLNEGVAVEEGPIPHQGVREGLSVIYFRDPDGHRLGVVALNGGSCV